MRTVNQDFSSTSNTRDISYTPESADDIEVDFNADTKAKALEVWGNKDTTIRVITTVTEDL